MQFVLGVSSLLLSPCPGPEYVCQYDHTDCHIGPLSSATVDQDKWGFSGRLLPGLNKGQALIMEKAIQE